jgi:hypothetical protein
MAEQRVIFIGTGSRTNQRIIVDLNPDGSLPGLVTFPDLPESHLEPGLHTYFVEQVPMGAPGSTTYALTVRDDSDPQAMPMYTACH